jgi:hypothetical protein
MDATHGVAGGCAVLCCTMAGFFALVVFEEGSQ